MCNANWNTKWYSCYEKHVVPHTLKHKGNSLAVQWLGLGAFTAGGPGSIPGQGTKISQALHQSTTPPQIKHRITMILQELKSLLLKVKELRMKKLA